MAPSPLVATSPILVVGPILPLLRTPLQSVGTLVDLPLPFDAAQVPSLVLEAAPRIRAAVTTGVGGFPSKLFGLLPSLEIISNFAVGYDSIGELSSLII